MVLRRAGSTLPQAFQSCQATILPQLGELVEGEVKPGEVGHAHGQLVLLHALQHFVEPRQGVNRAV